MDNTPRLVFKGQPADSAFAAIYGGINMAAKYLASWWYAVWPGQRAAAI